MRELRIQYCPPKRVPRSKEAQEFGHPAAELFCQPELHEIGVMNEGRLARSGRTGARSVPHTPPSTKFGKLIQGPILH